MTSMWFESRRDGIPFNPTFHRMTPLFVKHPLSFAHRLNPRCPVLIHNMSRCSVVA